MIYGFIGDTLFKQFSAVESGDAGLPPVCYLDDTIENYFEQRLTVTDTRETRLNPDLKGTIRLYFDAAKLGEDHLFLHLPEEERHLLFKLVEKLYTAESTALEVLEEDLTTDPQYSVVYIRESLRLGTKFTGTGLAADVLGPKTMRDYIQFEINLSVGRVEFKLWMSRVMFAADYPLSTISRVAFPCEAGILLNPGKVATVVDAVIQSTKFSFISLEDEVRLGDHSGLLVYETKYVINSNTIKMMPFGILYKGAKPGTLEIRKAIRDKLLSTGLADKSVWENILPDLFVVGQFFIAPIWNNTVVRPERSIFPSILKLASIGNVYKSLFPNFDPEYIADKQEMLTCAHSEIFLLCLADPSNETAFSIRALHPTYQLHSPQNSNYNYMEQKTREFSLRLNRCMGVLMGENVLDEFVENIFDDRTYLSFVSGGIEYHVLTKDSYPQN